MQTYHDPAAAVRRPFVVTPYRADAEGCWAPVSLPPQCPWAAEDPTRACRVRHDHWRARKTGPCARLAVARCRPHGHAFTLYPCGVVPYGRVPLAPVDPGGKWVHAPAEAPPRPAETLPPVEATPRVAVAVPSAEPEPVPDEATTWRVAWRGTLFEAALDAAQRVPWPRDGRGHAGRWWHTQGRWLELAALLLGLSGAVAVGLFARVLGVPELTLRDAISQYAAATGYQGRGATLVALLAVLPRAPHLADRLRVTGAYAGRWGTPWRWDPSLGRLRRCAFPAHGIPP